MSLLVKPEQTQNAGKGLPTGTLFNTTEKSFALWKKAAVKMNKPSIAETPRFHSRVQSFIHP
jgi:hypothetical protein